MWKLAFSERYRQSFLPYVSNKSITTKELLYTAQFVVSLCQQLPIEEKALFTQSFGKTNLKHGKSIRRLTSVFLTIMYLTLIDQVFLR